MKDKEKELDDKVVDEMVDNITNSRIIGKLDEVISELNQKDGTQWIGDLDRVYVVKALGDAKETIETLKGFIASYRKRIQVVRSHNIAFHKGKDWIRFDIPIAGEKFLSLRLARCYETWEVNPLEVKIVSEIELHSNGLIHSLGTARGELGEITNKLWTEVSGQPTDPIAILTEEYQEWLEDNEHYKSSIDLSDPKEDMSAGSLSLADDLKDHQRKYLADFIKRWDAAEGNNSTTHITSFSAKLHADDDKEGKPVKFKLWPEKGSYISEDKRWQVPQLVDGSPDIAGITGILHACEDFKYYGD